MSANPLRGQTDLPGAPEGVVFYMTNNDIAVQQAKFGRGWFSELPIALDEAAMEWIDELIKAGCKKADGKPAGLRVSAFDSVPVNDLTKVLLDSVYVSVTGRTFEEQLKWITEQQAAQRKAHEDARPTAAQEGGSESFAP